MDLDMDQMLIMGAICAAVYFTGYQSLAIGIFILLVLSSLVMGKKPSAGGVSTGGIKVSGAECLEPIIIETTRGPPFRIPSAMHIRVKPNWGGNTRYEKAMGKGLGRIGSLLYRQSGWGGY